MYSIQYDVSGIDFFNPSILLLTGSDSYMEEGNSARALSYYVNAYELAKKEDDNTTLAEVLLKMGKANAHQHKYSKAISLTKKGLQLAIEFKQLDLVILTHKTLSAIYENIGLPQKALEEFKIFNFYKDSLFNVNKYRAIAEMEMKYKTEKKEQQMEVLKGQNEVQQLKLGKRNRLYIASMLVIGLLAILAYILFRNHRLKARHRAVELEQKLMRSQMNPHFIFNSLIAIQSYIYKQDAVIAGDYLAKFADLIRITLENSRVELVMLAKELKMLKAYLELQMLRYDSGFDYQIEDLDKLEPESCLIPPMLAQPFIENAIEHGLRHKKEKGFIRIKYEKTGNMLRVTIEDNGVGRSRARELEKKRQHKSMATGITRERLKILSRKYHQSFELHIEDLKSGQGETRGTRVWFQMPFRRENT